MQLTSPPQENGELTLIFNSSGKLKDIETVKMGVVISGEIVDYDGNVIGNKTRVN